MKEMFIKTKDEVTNLFETREIRGVVFEIRKIKQFGNRRIYDMFRVSILTEENKIEYFIDDTIVEFQPFEEVIIEKVNLGQNLKIYPNKDKETFLYNKKISKDFIKKRFSYNPFNTFKKNKSFIKNKILNLWVPSIVFILFFLISLLLGYFEDLEYFYYNEIYSICNFLFGTRDDESLSYFQWYLATFIGWIKMFVHFIFWGMVVNIYFLLYNFLFCKYIFQVDISKVINTDNLQTDLKSHLWL